jgi:hypothetical protein
MNWTGGRLSRHSRKKGDSLVHKQKQHFAKVRSNLFHGNAKRSPVKWSIFDKIQVQSRADTASPSADHHLAYPSEARTNLSTTNGRSQKRKTPGSLTNSIQFEILKADHR